MTDVAIGLAAEQTAASVVDANLREQFKQKILAASCKISDPIRRLLAKHGIGSEKSRQAFQDAFAITAWATAWVTIIVALRLGFRRSLASGAIAMFIIIVSVEYVAML